MKRSRVTMKDWMAFPVLFEFLCLRAPGLINFSFCFFVPILGAIFSNLRYVRNISEYIL